MILRFASAAVVAALACDAGPHRDREWESATEETASTAVAESLYAVGSHDSAGKLFRVGLEAARAGGNEPGEARLLTWLGLNAMRSEDYENARRLGREALQLKLRLGLKEDLFRSYNALGLLAYQESRYFDAVDNHEQAIRLATESADTVNLSKAWNNLALTLIELGEYRRASELLRNALVAARGVGDRRSEGRVLTNLGMLDVRTGAPAASLPTLRSARQIAAETDDYLNELNALGQLSSAFSDIGEPGDAIAALDTALRLSRDPERGSRFEEASILEQLALAYGSAGDHRRALLVLEQSIAIDEEVGLPHERAVALRQVASIQSRLGNHDLADSAAVDALEAHRGLGAKLEVVWDLVVLAELRHRAGRPGEGRTPLAEAQRLARELGSSTARATIALSEARLADVEGRSGDALRYLREVAEFAGDAGPDSEWELHLIESRAHRRLGRFAAALAAAWRSFEAVERIRGEFAAGILRTSYVADRAAVYGELAEILIENGQVADAFAIADAARGRALLEHLETASGATGLTPRALIEEERQLLRQINVLTALAADVAGNDGDIAGEAARTRRLLERTRAQYGELFARSGRGAAGGTRSRRPLIDSLRGTLTREEVLLEFLVTDRGVLTFAVTRDTLAVAKTSLDGGDLVGRARVARELAGRPDAPPSAVRATFTALGEMLLGPRQIAAAISGKRVIVVVPHADLVYVPFAALVNPATGRWLVDDHAVLHLPSAASLAELRKRSNQLARGATAFAPFTKELPYTVNEVRALGRSPVQARSVTGRGATEAAVRTALASAGVVHVASHGVLNRMNPLFSRVDLAPGSGSASTDDGRLEVHEVIRLSIRPGLVFLSGCETGAGASASTVFDRGEDYATLAQAFLHAGAANVIATLWEVRDDGAAEFARRFYAALGGNTGGQQSPASALAAAQRGLRADPRFAAPYYWAAYVMNGTGSLNHVDLAAGRGAEHSPRRN